MLALRPQSLLECGRYDRRAGSGMSAIIAGANLGGCAVPVASRSHSCWMGLAFNAFVISPGCVARVPASRDVGPDPAAGWSPAAPAPKEPGRCCHETEHGPRVR
jgi:hypothetical protein